MSRRPIIHTELPGPRATAVIEASKQFVSSSYTRDYPLVAERGEGCWIIDPDGNEFLDMTSGIAVTATGHCHPEVVQAISDQAGKLVHMSGTDFYYPTQAKLAAALCPRTPTKGGDTRVYFGNSGAESLEAAIKLARWKTGRPNFVSFFYAFHGRTMGALALTGSKYIQKKGFGPMLSGFFHTTYPDPYRMGGDQNAAASALADLDRLFDTTCPPTDVAAIVIEPIQGEGGYIVPPDSFLVELRALCDKHGILLVFDEVQSGMGRTGKLWAYEHTGVLPDIVCSAKGIASGLPLCATFASGEVMQWPPGAHASTFGGNPVACAAALKTLELLDRELMANATDVGAHLIRELVSRTSRHTNVGQIRGRGLMVGVEIVRDRAGKDRAKALRNDIVHECFRRGLLILGCGPNTVRFAPALTLTRSEASTAAELFAAVLDGLTSFDDATVTISRSGKT